MADPVTAAVAVGWGMKAVGWFASPIISDLFKKGSSILGYDASEKLKLLEPKVLLLERVIQLVDESPYRPCLEQLFNELKSTFHEAEDILDDVEYRHLERQIHVDKFKSADGCVPPRRLDWITEKLQSALQRSTLKNKETGMSKSKLKKALEKIEHIIDDAYKTLKRLNLSKISDGDGREAIVTSSHTTGTPPLKVIGRDEDRDKIIAMLHDKEDDGQSNANSGLCYSVVGIHGISGSGKTTLAQHVYEQEKIYTKEEKGDHFDLVLWVNVSQKFNILEIYREMTVAASHGSWGHIVLLDLNSQQETLEGKLRDKRFFLVLDDVWCNNKGTRDMMNLPQLLCPLKVGKRGSKVLVTCRNADALSDLGPDVKTTPFPIHDLNDDAFHKLFMYYALGDRATDDQDSSTLWSIGAHIAAKLKRSPLAARIVGGQLRKRKNVESWRRAKDQDLLNETMGALSWSYQHLDVEVRRCFAYCSLFPVQRHLKRDEIVRLWVAEGFIRNSTSTGKDMEDVGYEYFDELVSSSFLQPGTERYYGHYIMHDLLHHLAERVAGGDCFRIENGWKGEVPQGVRHLFVDDYNGEMLNIVGRTIELENLCTLIVSGADIGKQLDLNLLESMFKRLLKLRVLSVGFFRKRLSLPENICLLHHLRFLALRIAGPSCGLVISPRTLSKLYHMQTLDFGNFGHLWLASDEKIVNLVNLRYASTNLCIHLNISRSTSLQKLATFSVDEHTKLKQLRDLNKIRGTLHIFCLHLVKSKEEALEARLPDKERLTKLVLFGAIMDVDKNPEVEAEVLEGLCPPTCLEELSIKNYSGATYPNWMVGKQSSGPKYLQQLELHGCSRIGPVPDLFVVFTHLHSFSLSFCGSWDTLPDTIRHLKSLKKLKMHSCLSIRSLPELPQSLQTFQVEYCDEAFMRSCQTIGDPNYQKIEHIATREFRPCLSSSPINSNHLKGVAFDDNVSIIGA